jgi:hypothetical protein
MKTKEIAPIDARTYEQLASRRRTIKTVRGFGLDVHRDGVFISVSDEGGDSIWVPRRIWDKLIRWYVGDEG